MATATVSDLLISSAVDNDTVAMNSTTPPAAGGDAQLPITTWLIPVIIGIVILVGVVGNVLVIYVIARAGQRTVTNYYMVNLAIADILCLLLCAPAEAGNFASPGGYVFGGFMCKTASYMQYVTVQATSFILAAMSADRYQAIVRPLKSLKSRTIKTAVIISTTIWLFGLLLYIPNLLYLNLEYSEYQGSLNPYCKNNFPSRLATAYRLVVFLFPFALPMMVIAICYGVMVRHLWLRVAPSDSLSGPANAANSERNRRQKRKVTWMVLTVVLAFFVCWFPFQFYSMWANFDPNFPYTTHTFNFRTASLVMIFVNSCVNPFIYAFLGENFRKSFRKAFPCCFKKTGADGGGTGRTEGTGTQGSTLAGPSTRPGRNTEMISLPAKSKTDA